ncbi:MAG TPA: LLM class flavin-dependent oxidoreductase [Chloroflexota bacterium]|nr:LLM class flavin-dependent oxidoreductase [Chloroflexota bacterium]
MKVRVGLQLGGASSPADSGQRFWSVIDRCEALDVDSVWLSERMSGRLPDTMAAMAAIVGRTRNLKVGTSILVLPAYNPVHVAKFLATLDVLSDGRVLPSVGVGIDDPREVEALALDKPQRGRRLDEAITLMKRLWTETDVTFVGEFYHVTNLTLWPRPTGPLPRALWLGGTSAAAHRRVGHLCDGWLPSARTPDEVAEGISAIRAFAREAGREVPEDHYGALVPISFVEEPPAQTAARRPGVNPREYAAFGSSASMRALLQRYVHAGATKLVVAPIRPEDLAQLDRIREEVMAPLEATDAEPLGAAGGIAPITAAVDVPSGLA